MTLAVRSLSLALAIAMLGAGTASADYDTVLASRIGKDGAASNRLVFGPELSGNGRYIAFASNATNFPGAGTSKADARIYVKDTNTGKLILASRADGANGEPLQGGDWPALSRSGRYVCWVATEFGDFTGFSYDQFEGPPPMPGDQLMVRDLKRNETRAVPGSAIGSLSEDYGEYGPSCAITKDGTKVAYMTKERHDPADDDAQIDIYLYEFETGKWTFLSKNGPEPYGPNELAPVRHPEMTPDGRHVVFWAHGGRGGVPIVSPVGKDEEVGRSGPQAVFVADTATGELNLVSKASGCDSPPPPYSPPAPEGEDIPSNSLDAAISDDGRYVAFASNVTTLDPTARGIEQYDETGRPIYNVYVRDRKECTTQLVSRASGKNGQPATKMVMFSAISPDGRYVAFGSGTQNLDRDARDDGESFDVFIRDVKAARTTLVSRSSGLFGAPANGVALFPQLSADKGRVVFLSSSDNLSPTPTGVIQIYYRETVGSRGLLPANLPGRPKIRDLKVSRLARGAFRRGRAFLSFDLSEFARVYAEVTGDDDDKIVKRVEGAEGRNRLTLRKLKPGRYRVTVEAVDFNYDRSRRTVEIVVR